LIFYALKLEKAAIAVQRNVAAAAVERPACQSKIRKKEAEAWQLVPRFV
jgi:hypothetical protein